MDLPAHAQPGVSPIAASSSHNDQLPRHLLSPVLSIEADDGAFVRRIEALCAPAGDRNDLLAVERKMAAGVASATSPQLIELGCVRARLDAVGAVAHERPLMPLGASWGEGAQRALLRASERGQLDARGADLLAVLAFDAPLRALNDSITGVLHRNVAAGVPSVAAVRGCVTLGDANRRTELVAECIQRGLDAGNDSTWLLLGLARIAARQGDTVSTRALFGDALGRSGDSDDWAEVAWQVKWFADSSEWSEWERLPDSLRAAWIQDRFASRDVRDGQPVGSRLVEHFHRLDHVSTAFRVDIPRRLRMRALQPANPESRRKWDEVVAYWEPGLAPARPYRFAQLWAPGYDDRATVWMRFGRPESTRQWSAVDTLRGPIRDIDPRPPATNTRAVWTYRVDTRSLVVSFESEQLAGSVEPTRIVEGVLGSYFCGVDRWRCELTSRSEMAAMGRAHIDPTRPKRGDGFSPVPVDQMERLRTNDREIIATVTQRDDNSIASERALSVIGQVHRVWNSRDGTVLAVFPGR